LALHRHAQAAIVGALFDGEKVEFCFQGAHKQALVGTDRRVLIYKGGPTGPLVSWDYEHVKSVQLHRSRMATGVVVLDVSGLPPVSTSFWATGTGDAAKAPNAVPLNDSGSVAAADVAVRLLRTRLEAGHGRPRASRFAGGHTSDRVFRRIIELSDLRDQGAITPDEFAILRDWLLETGGADLP
jgi:hypothetical protein